MSTMTCKNCGSADTSWDCVPKNYGQALDGRICMREIGVLFVLGCNDCSETLKAMDAGSFMDEFNAHLAQPAQAVGVGALRKGFMTAESCGPDDHFLLKIKFQSLGDLQAAHNTLARVLSGEKAGPVGDGKARAFALHAAVGAIYFADGSDYLSALWEVVRELAPEQVDELADDPSAVWHRAMAATDRFTLPASPAPDKETR